MPLTWSRTVTVPQRAGNYPTHGMSSAALGLAPALQQHLSCEHSPLLGAHGTAEAAKRAGVLLPAAGTPGLHALTSGGVCCSKPLWSTREPDVPDTSQHKLIPSFTSFSLIKQREEAIGFTQYNLLVSLGTDGYWGSSHF